MSSNPFKYDKPLSPVSDHLVGRSQEKRDIINYVHNEKHIFLCGNKTIGKTSLINFVIDELNPALLALFVDCRGIRG